jgi:hypothetical protein
VPLCAGTFQFAEHALRVDETKIVCSIVIETPLEKLSFVRPRRCKDNFKMDLKEMWMEFTQNRVR